MNKQASASVVSVIQTIPVRLNALEKSIAEMTERLSNLEHVLQPILREPHPSEDAQPNQTLLEETTSEIGAKIRTIQTAINTNNRKLDELIQRVET